MDEAICLLTHDLPSDTSPKEFLRSLPSALTCAPNYRSFLQLINYNSDIEEFTTPISLQQLSEALQRSFAPSPARKVSKSGLKSLTSQVQSIIREQEFLTFEQIIDCLLLDSSEERNTKRRVYDCLNVMEAAGAIQKSGKRFFWNDGGCAARKKSFLQQKRRILRRRVQECVAVKNLVFRNQYQQRIDVLKLPFVAVCMDGSVQDKVLIERSQSGRSATFKFTSKITLKNEYDVLLSLGFGRDSSQELQQISEKLYEYYVLTTRAG